MHIITVAICSMWKLLSIPLLTERIILKKNLVFLIRVWKLHDYVTWQTFSSTFDRSGYIIILNAIKPVVSLVFYYWWSLNTVQAQYRTTLVNKHRGLKQVWLFCKSSLKPIEIFRLVGWVGLACYREWFDCATFEAKYIHIKH